MATSLINTDCKRYGCRKNLLACYANCRYNTRCDELRSEVTANFEQATRDINTYRQEHGLHLINIQIPKRGLKFAEIASLPAAPAMKKRPSLKTKVPRQHHPLQKVVDKDREPRAAKPVFKRKTKKRRAKPRITTAQASKIQPSPRLETTLQPGTRPAQTLKSRQSKPTKLNRESPRKMPRKTKAQVVETTTGNEERRLATPAETASLLQPELKIGATSRKGAKSAAKKPKKFYIILEGERGTLVGEQGLLNRILAGVSPGARYFEATELEVRLQISKK